jgi:hypothetical protein
MGVLFRVLIVLQALQELQKNLLGDLAPSSFKISKTSQTEVSIEVVRGRVKRPADSQLIGRLARLTGHF